MKQVHLTKKIEKPNYMSCQLSPATRVPKQQNKQTKKLVVSTSLAQKIGSDEICSQKKKKTLYHTDVQCTRIVETAVDNKMYLMSKSWTYTDTDVSCNGIR